MAIRIALAGFVEIPMLKTRTEPQRYCHVSAGAKLADVRCTAFNSQDGLNADLRCGSNE